MQETVHKTSMERFVLAADFSSFNIDNIYRFQPGTATQELPYGIYYFTENLIFAGMNIYLPHFGQSSFITKHVL